MTLKSILILSFNDFDRCLKSILKPITSAGKKCANFARTFRKRLPAPFDAYDERAGGGGHGLMTPPPVAEKYDVTRPDKLSSPPRRSTRNLSD